MEPEKQLQALKDIVPTAHNNINAKFILLDKGRVTLEGRHKTCLALAADESAAVHFQLWGDECDAFEPGDIILLANGIFSYNRNNLVLRAGKRGKAEKVGEFTMAYVETPNMSEIRWVPDSSDSIKYVQEAVISPHSRNFPPMH
ncbi:Nucleic acid-binding [Forsythia ovata]|uniref:Nucleic acid-binding n=1 Tax=Forsythia ovata TaxID=205694 RepID=A0ABD1T4V4_9LAMI